MDRQVAEEPAKPDFWGDVFDLAATAVIFLGWIGIIGLCVGLALMVGPLLFGKTVTFKMEGPVTLLVIGLSFPVFSIVAGRFLRRRARTSTPARIGIAVLAGIYGAFAALRIAD